MLPWRGVGVVWHSQWVRASSGAKMACWDAGVFAIHSARAGQVARNPATDPMKDT